MDKAPHNSPLLTGFALLGAGLLVRRWQPTVLDIPEEEDASLARDRGWRRAARRSRDGVAKVMPGNLTGSIGRSLIVMGAGLILVRVLDEMVEDDHALF
jgi:hypothetical protein